MGILQLGEALVSERRYGAILTIFVAGTIAGYIFGQALELANMYYHSRKNKKVPTAPQTR